MGMASTGAGASGRPRSMTVAAAVAVAFGVATIFSGGGVLFGPAAARHAAGEVVLFVLWFNFASGFIYVAAGVGLWRVSQWGFLVAAGLAIAIAGVLAAFAVHVAGGGAFEMRTLYALILRLGVWCAIVAGACYTYACPRLVGRR